MRENKAKLYNIMRASVAIIGAGFSGTLTAIHLAQTPSTANPIDIYLIDPRTPFGPGLAYSPPSERFKLNVRAKGMGAFPNDAEGFYRWLVEKNPTASPEDFVPRRLYGEYLSHLLQEALSQPHGNVIHRVNEEVVDITSHIASGTCDIILKSGQRLAVDACVIAIGNIMQSPPCGTESAPALRQPFDPKSYDDLSELKRIFILGSGLTAVDVILEAEARGFTGTFTVLSRHGRFPRPHEELPSSGIAYLPSDWDTRGSVRALVSTIRAESRRLGSSQPVFEAMRPKIQSMWTHFSLGERKRFLRHVRSVWEVHRHRIPHEHAAIIEQLRSSGRLQIIAGKLLDCERDGARLIVLLRERGSSAPISQRFFDIGYLCVGPEGDLQKTRSPLLQRLVAQNLIIPGPLKLGGIANDKIDSLWLVGPIQRETHWEITAVRELREEAARTAQAVARRVLRT
jgi:uncharacterized NAD(P)/FAD-binding protein YdhS